MCIYAIYTYIYIYEYISVYMYIYIYVTNLGLKVHGSRVPVPGAPCDQGAQVNKLLHNLEPPEDESTETKFRMKYVKLLILGFEI